MKMIIIKYLHIWVSDKKKKTSHFDDTFSSTYALTTNRVKLSVKTFRSHKIITRVDCMHAYYYDSYSTSFTNFLAFWSLKLLN